jgi:hypothetical protein
MDRTIQQGDAFAAVCGVKEPRGRVRCLGRGPTPQDIGTPGLKAYTSTRLQIQVWSLGTSKGWKWQSTAKTKYLRNAKKGGVKDNLTQHGSNSRQHMVQYFEKPFHSTVLVYKSKFLSYTNLNFWYLTCPNCHITFSTCFVVTVLHMLDVEPKIWGTWRG